MYLSRVSSFPLPFLPPSFFPSLFTSAFAISSSQGEQLPSIRPSNLRSMQASTSSNIGAQSEATNGPSAPHLPMRLANNAGGTHPGLGLLDLYFSTPMSRLSQQAAICQQSRASIGALAVACLLCQWDWGKKERIREIWEQGSSHRREGTKGVKKSGCGENRGW